MYTRRLTHHSSLRLGPRLLVGVDLGLQLHGHPVQSLQVRGPELDTHGGPHPGLKHDQTGFDRQVVFGSRIVVVAGISLQMTEQLR